MTSHDLDTAVHPQGEVERGRGGAGRDERNLVRVAVASLPEVEATANTATEEFCERVNAALAELREALVERQRRRAALGWARDVAAGRRGKVIDGSAVVDAALRGVHDLLRR